MRITDPTTTQHQLSEAVNWGTVQNLITPEEASTFVNPGFQVSYQGSEYTFDLGRDGVWRLGCVSTWGNYEGVSGEGCDASGLRITDPELRAGLQSKIAE